MQAVRSCTHTVASLENKQKTNTRTSKKNTQNCLNRCGCHGNGPTTRPMPCSAAAKNGQRLLPAPAPSCHALLPCPRHSACPCHFAAAQGCEREREPQHPIVPKAPPMAPPTTNIRVQRPVRSCMRHAAPLPLTGRHNPEGPAPVRRPRHVHVAPHHPSTPLPFHPSIDPSCMPLELPE